MKPSSTSSRKTPLKLRQNRVTDNPPAGLGTQTKSNDRGGIRKCGVKTHRRTSMIVQSIWSDRKNVPAVGYQGVRDERNANGSGLNYYLVQCLSFLCNPNHRRRNRQGRDLCVDPIAGVTRSYNRKITFFGRRRPNVTNYDLNATLAVNPPPRSEPSC